MAKVHKQLSFDDSLKIQCVSKSTVFKILVAFHLDRSPLSDAKNLTGVRNFGKTTPDINMSSSVSFTFLEIPCLRLMQIH